MNNSADIYSQMEGILRWKSLLFRSEIDITHLLVVILSFVCLKKKFEITFAINDQVVEHEMDFDVANF